MPTIGETVAETVHYVFPQHAGAPGRIYGGRMMEWIAMAGTLAASRVARGPVVLGAMDDMDFLHPVRVGEIAILRARVEWIGRASLEVAVRVEAEEPASGRREVTLASHLAFVAIDDKGRPRPVDARLTPADARERAIAEGARARREARAARRAGEAAAGRLATAAWRLETSRFVFPEDALDGTLMFAGRLLFLLDEAAALLAVRYARAPLATASVDAVDFRAPVRVGDVLTLRSALTRVGTRSLEVGVEVQAEDPFSGDVRQPCTAYLSFVQLRGAGPPLPPLGEAPDPEAAARRQAQRLARVRRLREALTEAGDW